MALTDLLGFPSGQMTVPGFAGGQFPIGGGGPAAPMALPNMSGDIDAALARNAQLGAQQRQQGGGGLFGGALKVGSPIRDFLGSLGDALLVANGMTPMYRERKLEKQRSAALQGFLTDPDTAIAQLMQVDPASAIQLHQSRQTKEPEEIRLMRMIGIDPASEEGRSIITRKLSGAGQADPNFVRELEALGIDPRSDEARELYYGRNSPAGYLLRPKGRAASPSPQGGGSGPQVGTVVGGYRFKGGNPNDRNSWEPVSGGPTARPSGPFPASGN